uniref:Mobilization protein n=1 Tax=Anisakis simplex TaxID=6269 RepID=A0A0M3JF75_ANISI
LTDYENQVMGLRRHNDELDTQLKTSQAKITTLENSIASAQKEIAKLTELNSRLQKEKNDIMRSTLLTQTAFAEFYPIEQLIP